MTSKTLSLRAIVATSVMFAALAGAPALAQKTADPMKADAMKADTMKADPMKADAMKADPMKADAMKADPMKADAMKAAKPHSN